MKDAGSKSDQFIFIEDGAHYADIIQMACQNPGVISDEYIARFVSSRWKFGYEIFDSQGHGSRLARGCKGALGQFSALLVCEHASVIMGISEQA
jgi:hypothetical protein